MNRFGRIAQQRWKALAPGATARLEDPDQHFSMLGDQAMAAWQSLVEQMETKGPWPGGLEAIGRANRIRSQADEIVIAEYCDPPVIEPDWQEEKEDAGSPLDARKRRHLYQLQEFLEDGWTLEEMGLTMEDVAKEGWKPEDVREAMELGAGPDARRYMTIVPLTDVLETEPFLSTSVRWQKQHPGESLWDFWGIPPQPVNWPGGYTDLLEEFGLPTDFPISPLRVMNADR
jgi:hypothetical protein